MVGERRAENEGGKETGLPGGSRGGLRIGETDEGPDGAGTPFYLPDRTATEATAILGIRGSGKTVTATVLVEELLKLGQQAVIVDPTDVWWGLKSSADGESGGLPVVVLGGPHGDLPLEEGDALALADFAVETGAPLVLSLRHLRKNAQRRFVTDFAEHLYHRKGEVEHRTPLLVVIDEASSFAPQRVGAGEARMVGAVEDLVRRGRSSGLGVALVDQRPASLNKDVLTQVSVLVSHQVTSPQDRKALDEWISQHDTAGYRKELLKRLPALPTGEAWFWSPYLDLFERVRVRMRETYDSSRTPELGESPKPPTAWADVDLEALRELLAGHESVGDPGNDGDAGALKRHIGELEAEKEKTLERVAALERELAEERKAKGSLLERAELLEAKVREGRRRATEIAEVLLGEGEAEKPPEERPESAPDVSDGEAPGAERGAPVRKAPKKGKGGSPGKKRPLAVEALLADGARTTEMPDPRRRILAALLYVEALGLDALDARDLARFSGQSPTSRRYEGHLAALRRDGLIEYRAGGVRALTAAGRDAARGLAGEDESLAGGPSRWEKPRSQESLHAAWFALLPDPQVRLLSALIERHPDWVSFDELAVLSDQSPTSRRYEGHRATLRRLGLIEYHAGGGRAKATDLLFPKEP